MKMYTEVELGEGDEYIIYDCTVDFDYTPGDPGRYTGPWEKCYPAEPPEVIINSITDNSTNIDVFDKIPDVIERIENECYAEAERKYGGDYD